MQLNAGSSGRIYQKIKDELGNLPGEEAHLRMHPRRPSVSSHLAISANGKKSAVLALFYEHKNTLFGLLTERQDYDGNHSGQMSFPGGRMEEVDTTLHDTALRETEEEIGIQQSSVEILGKLTEVYISVSNYVVQPYIGISKEKPKLVLNEREVKSVIHFPVEKILTDDAISLSRIRLPNGVWIKDVPSFILDEKIVWGATALILNEIREILLRLK